MTITTDASTPVGQSTITVTGFPLNRTTTFTLDVAAGSKPDLIISRAPVLNTGTINEGFPVTFKAMVQNGGLAIATSFTGRFFIDLNNDGSLDVALPIVPGSTVALLDYINGNNTANIISGTWTAVRGKHRVIVCADDPDGSDWGSSPSDDGDINESNENNNCSSVGGGSLQGTGIIFVGQFQQF